MLKSKLKNIKEDLMKIGLSNAEILDKVKDKRTKCIVYTRVMGYHRPVEGFNLGKKGEHKERIKFVERDIKCCY